MIETRRLKNVVIFIQTILNFVLSRKIINIYNDIARKYGNIIDTYDRLGSSVQYEIQQLLVESNGTSEEETR